MGGGREGERCVRVCTNVIHFSITVFLFCSGLICFCLQVYETGLSDLSLSHCCGLLSATVNYPLSLPPNLSTS